MNVAITYIGIKIRVVSGKSDRVLAILTLRTLFPPASIRFSHQRTSVFLSVNLVIFIFFFQLKKKNHCCYYYRCGNAVNFALAAERWQVFHHFHAATKQKIPFLHVLDGFIKSVKLKNIAAL
ncbi:hypothetical protein FcAc13_06020 [Frischella sp. Ac13]|uniref:Uncharacterized protein n=1 Tax=Frischella japonica TaxID=2741544 RepID=A0ABR7QXB7_9GAMM|nr:hypothetical protein [Frischella japonica]MBC9130864.1 hypothetical protein [Frischella japonica]